MALPARDLGFAVPSVPTVLDFGRAVAIAAEAAFPEICVAPDLIVDAALATLAAVGCAAANSFGTVFDLTGVSLRLTGLPALEMVWCSLALTGDSARVFSGLGGLSFAKLAVVACANSHRRLKLPVSGAPELLETCELWEGVASLRDSTFDTRLTGGRFCGRIVPVPAGALEATKEDVLFAGNKAPKKSALLRRVAVFSSAC